MRPCVLAVLDPVLHPVDPTRWLAMVLLATLVTALLFIGSSPGVEVVIPNPPWDKLAHLLAFFGFGSLAWVALKGESQAGPVAIAGLIAVMDESMQYYSPGRTADVRDIAADLVGALLAVLVLGALKAKSHRARRVESGRSG